MDQYGANLAADSLPSGGFRTIHNSIQSLVQSMMKVAGIHNSEKEAANFLLGKVSDPWMSNYVDHIASQTLMLLYQIYLHMSIQQVGKQSMIVGLLPQERHF